MIHNIKYDIECVCKYYLSFKNLKDIAEKETNMKVSIVEILCKKSKGLKGRREGLFDYHVDSKWERRNIKVSIIFYGDTY